MEPEGSLPHSQVPATCPYPEPARSSPYPHFLKIHLNIILPSMPWSSKWSLPQVSPPKLYMPPSHPYVLHAPPISLGFVYVLKIFMPSPCSLNPCLTSWHWSVSCVICNRFRSSLKWAVFQQLTWRKTSKPLQTRHLNRTTFQQLYFNLNC